MATDADARVMHKARGFAKAMIPGKQKGARKHRLQKRLARGRQKPAGPPVVLGLLAKKADEKTQLGNGVGEAAGHGIWF